MNRISNNCEFNWHCAVIRFVPHIFGLLLSMLTDLNLGTEIEHEIGI